MFEKFTEKAKRILFLARYGASQQGRKVIGTEHILLGLLKEGEETTRELFTRANVSMDLLQAELERRNPPREKLSTSVEIPFSEETKKALQFAEEEAERLMHPHIGTEHLLLGLLRLEDSVAGRMLAERGMRLFAVREDAVNIYKRRALPKKKKETPFLNEFARDLSEMAQRRVFDPLIGREVELERVVQVLSRRRKNNPVLLGEPGVGKTAIVEGLATRIVDGEVPPSLLNERFHGVRFDGEALRASVYQSNRYITDRFLPDKAIDVLDEAGARVKLGKRISYGEIKKVEQELRRAVDGMKNALARKDFDEAVAYHDKEVTLRRRHEELKQRYEDEANRILDVTRADVEEVIARWTGIPLQSVAQEEMDKLLNMEGFLHQRIVGQEESSSALSRAIRRSRAGLKSPNRPIGSFIFLGATGGGKTGGGRTLAAFLFGSGKSLLRFGISADMEKHANAQVIG